MLKNGFPKKQATQRKNRTNIVRFYLKTDNQNQIISILFYLKLAD